MEFKENLRKAMGHETMNSLGRRTGLGGPAISYYLDGSRKPGVDSLKALCAALPTLVELVFDVRVTHRRKDESHG